MNRKEQNDLEMLFSKALKQAKTTTSFRVSSVSNKENAEALKQNLEALNAGYNFSISYVFSTFIIYASKIA